MDEVADMPKHIDSGRILAYPPFWARKMCRKVNNHMVKKSTTSYLRGLFFVIFAEVVKRQG